MSSTTIRYQQPDGGWARTFTDIRRDKLGAKAFVGGTYLQHDRHRTLEHGTLVLEVSPQGSSELARFYRVTEDGLERIGCELLPDGSLYDWRVEFMQCLDEAAHLLQEARKGRRYSFYIREGLSLFVSAPTAPMAQVRARNIFVEGRYLCGDIGSAQAAAFIRLTAAELNNAVIKDVTDDVTDDKGAAA